VAALIVGVDVAHVYSTLYRTYFDPVEFRQRRTLYVMAPLLAGWPSSRSTAWLHGVLASPGLPRGVSLIRQQYGFMMIYRRHERGSPALDRAAIYAATLYPLLWWHCHQRHFSWFVEGDFFG